MNPLPQLYVQWEPSAADPAVFLRYQVYRRQVGGNYTKIARIPDQALNFYQDFNTPSGVEMEYNLTQVIAADTGEELESAFVTPVAGTVTARSLFIHDVRNPEFYVELGPLQTTVKPHQDQGWVQPRNRATPTMHIGRAGWRTIEVSILRQWDVDKETWERLEELWDRQRTHGAILCARGYRLPRAFCQLTDIPRSDRPIVFNASISFTEAHFEEDVDAA